MFSSLLIANRGEIACRIARTARRLGLRTIAVHSEADAGARHVREADESWLIGPAPAAESYLVAERILEVARASGAEAIHPGYGFLSENAGFAEACAAAGIVFVGPPAPAIRAMGSKSEAKALMEKAGVPLVPGYHGAEQDPALLAAEAGRIGFPVLIKASAGGGGKGMRPVRRAKDFAAELEGAQREARAAFGDDRVLLEKYLTKPRHIELQVFCDGQGRGVHLFERDCSIQRRHQKVVEEAPAPGMTAERRAAMAEAALAAAAAIGYVGAGTVEFIAEGDDFFFMEMNTRLQVEHPVTEAITGQDLVEWQLRVAAGEPLPLAQGEIGCSGHAIEVRLYAEDPSRDFLPATGRLAHLAFPQEVAGLRVDSGVETGDEITPFYDPMIAKVIVHGPDRAAAVRRLQQALAGTEVAGLTTNLPLLSAIAGHPAFAAAGLDTGFIPRHAETLLAPPPPPDADSLALACLAELLRRQEEAKRLATASADRFSPWFRTDGWRLNDETQRRLTFRAGELEVSALVHYRPGGGLVEVEGRRIATEVRRDSSGRLAAFLDGRLVRARDVWDGDLLTLIVEGRARRLMLVDALAGTAGEDEAGGRLVAPMPGKVVSVSITAGATVERGQALLVLEAMKMEHGIVAPADGIVTAVHYAEGDTVEEGADLIDFEAAEA
ncbi:3-methylcrotonoyl-CoA carboxylase, alpha subunit [Tistlia consotensis]|uniref:3-methylcrotonoyl-CoA carboxylase, alpha subunit n=1 Tax=Tistlia consotensis USBA 355 TaxID=560819 RepID=A0A1Y6CBT7_9PROT|nr:acetyl/propionyl/methylcrotonyl-CoA carboxylase subunit alpha [Tistlia consotensis]SMF44624.1 3-methylcrotonoyl-CoA carboxylase, alpha subunit [Tistlia consotensis USBA 355]SNR43408.1 3-methylcrotonoyl-CoA carboxylase, alpha subunit [Tistlia consotensis]